MNRFFVDPNDISGNSITLGPETGKHIRSLRLRPDELFIICDGNGYEYECRLGDHGAESSAEIINKYASIGEPTLKCIVYIAYSKGERMEYAVQKAVELGAHEIILFESERCVAVPRDVSKKAERLQRIALEAAKQCNRGIIPKVTPGGRFNEVIDKAVKCSDLSLLFYECEEDRHLKDILEEHFPSTINHNDLKNKTVSIITGPEGGFEPHEVKLSESKSIITASLGTRILRSETAPVVALAAVMYHTNNM